jgi:predicted metal-dependent enzyme (double-stranded beta helix superfamily)
MLRGAEVSTSFGESAAGMEQGEDLTLRPGDVAVVSPTVGDIHQVRNAYADRVSISIHAYGANIGKQVRHVFDACSGARKDFVSGYSTVAA